MIHLQNKSIQNVNIVFSCGAIFMLVTGIVVENWVELIPKLRKEKTTHSPWLGCCPAYWPEGSLGIIKSMMMMSLNIAIYLNLVFGLQYTSMISQNKCVHLIIGFMNFFTGIFCFIQSSNRCACLLNREGSGKKLNGNSIQVISLPERTIMPRSIVHVHSTISKDGSSNKPHVQTRRVTWAL
ncbi:transmembrane protein 225 isoform X2 [Microtus pennsylvanicus]|uniref:transmembrane protein 225 isoform X2 n=1 Tax=Microtus pennsylvanicus TaxID=10058 RepID=UPI003F6B8F9C